MKKMLTEDFSPNAGVCYVKGTVGAVLDTEWPNANPTVLVFGNDVRDCFPDNILEDVRDDEKLSEPISPYSSGKPIEQEPDAATFKRTKRLYKVWQYLYYNLGWQPTPKIFDAAGLPRTFLHVMTSKNHRGASMESLGLAERDRSGKRPTLWRLTDKGRSEGYKILQSLNREFRESNEVQ